MKNFEVTATISYKFKMRAPSLPDALTLANAAAQMIAKAGNEQVAAELQNVIVRQVLSHEEVS